MPWVKFEKATDWHHPEIRGYVVAFPKGMVYFVTREQAVGFIAKKQAREATPEEIEHARRR